VETESFLPPAARIMLRQGARVLKDTGQWQ